MSRHDLRVTLLQIRDYAKEAIAMAHGRSLEDLDNDRMLELSLTRLVEVVGEPARRISREDQAKLPDIPWSDLIGLRNRLSHGYDNINVEILWSTVKIDLPPLVEHVERALR